MIQGIRFELKKYIATKNHLIILLIITLVEIGLFIWKTGGFLYEKSVRDGFYAQAEENFSKAGKQELIDEKERINQELYKTDADGGTVPDYGEMNKKGKYSDTRIDDYAFLNELITGIEIVEKRNQNTALLADTFGGGDYQKEDNAPYLGDRKKLTAVANNMFAGWIPCLILIILLSASFSVEYEGNINPVLCITKGGAWSVSLTKIITGLFTAIALNIYFWGIFIFLQSSLLGMTGQDWKQPLFLADEYQMCASGMTIQNLLVKQILISILVSFLTAMFTMALSKWIKKGIIVLLAALVVFVVMLVPDLLNMAIYSSTYVTEMNNWYLMSEPAFYKMLNLEKMFNPVSMVQFQYYAQQPRYTQFFGIQYPVYCIPVMFAVILIGILGIGLFYEKSGRCKA